MRLTKTTIQVTFYLSQSERRGLLALGAMLQALAAELKVAP